MANHGGRGRINIRPLTDNYCRYHHKVLSDSLPKEWRAEALTDEGLLARNNRTGTLAIWQGFSMKSVDARKAEASLNGDRNERNSKSL